MSDLVYNIFLWIGIVFTLVGCIGIVRMPDFYMRLHPIVKSITFGTCLVLFGIFLKDGFSTMGIRALLCILFVLLTMPTVIHAFARGTYKYGIRMGKSKVIDEYEK